MKKSLWFITEEDGRCRQIVNDVVTSLNKKTALPNNPIGAADISILWERNLTYWGIIRSFSLPLAFVTDGATILRNDYYKFNIDRKLFLLIKRFVCETDAVYYKKYYKQLYKGEIDFSSFEDEPEQRKVTVSLMEGGVNKLLKANENTQFTIPFDEDAVNVRLDGVYLYEKLNYQVMDYDSYFDDNIMGVSYINNEGVAPGVSAFTVAPNQVNLTTYDFTEAIDYFFYTATSIADINLKFPFTFRRQDGLSGGTLQLCLKSNLGRNDILATQVNNPGTINVDHTFTSSVNEKFFLTIEYINGTYIVSQSNLTISFKNKYVASYTKAFKPYDLYKKLCLKLGIAENLIISSLLQSSTYLLASGDSVRGLSGSGIKTSLSAFFKAFHIYEGAAISIDKGIMSLDLRDDLFILDSITPAVELGEVKDFKLTPATDLLFSSIKVGHAEQNIDNVNGKYDFNGFHIYTTPIKSVSRQLDLQSPYKAGPYEIEITRINLEGKTTTDNSNDNDVFVLDCVTSGVVSTFTVLLSFVSSGNYIVFPSAPKIAPGTVFKVTGSTSNDGIYTVTAVEDDGITQTVHTDITISVAEFTISVTVDILSGLVYELDRSVIPDTGSVPDPDTIFNVRLRPSELLKKHYRWIRSALYNYDTEIIKFESANRNKDLKVAGIVDGRNIAISSMGSRIFIPDYMECTVKTPIDLSDDLEVNLNRCFAIINDGKRYTGFTFKAGLAPNSRATQVFKLLSSIENSRNDLIL